MIKTFWTNLNFHPSYNVSLTIQKLNTKVNKWSAATDSETVQTAKDQRLLVIHQKEGINRQYCMPAPDAAFVIIKISYKIFYNCFINNYCNLNNEIPIFEAKVVNFCKSFFIEYDMSIR